ncbi:MAG TPA: hypothetical protein VMR41_05695 [Patescibacteria group bacterium]|nr:hypothetical protein [Patescibacteria group bacterium]
MSAGLIENERFRAVSELSVAEQTKIRDRSALACLFQASFGRKISRNHHTRRVIYSDVAVNDFRTALADFRWARDNGMLSIPREKLEVVEERVIANLREQLADAERRKEIEESTSPDTGMLREILALDKQFFQLIGETDVALDFLSPHPVRLRVINTDNGTIWVRKERASKRHPSVEAKTVFSDDHPVAVVASMEPIDIKPKAKVESEVKPKLEIQSNPEDVLRNDLNPFECAVWITAFVTNKKDPQNPLLAFPDAKEPKYLYSVAKNANQPRPDNKDLRKIGREVGFALERVQEMLRAAAVKPDLMPEKMKDGYERLVKFDPIYFQVGPEDLSLVLTREIDWNQFVQNQRAKQKASGMD